MHNTEYKLLKEFSYNYSVVIKRRTVIGYVTFIIIIIFFFKKIR